MIKLHVRTNRYLKLCACFADHCSHVCFQADWLELSRSTDSGPWLVIETGDVLFIKVYGFLVVFALFHLCVLGLGNRNCGAHDALLMVVH